MKENTSGFSRMPRLSGAHMICPATAAEAMPSRLTTTVLGVVIFSPNASGDLPGSCHSKAAAVLPVTVHPVVQVSRFAAGGC